VTGVVGKQNIYKNGNVENLIYIATNKGIYVSSNMGQNWTLVVSGNYTAIY
jgi:hypothetical protein